MRAAGLYIMWDLLSFIFTLSKSTFVGTSPSAPTESSVPHGEQKTLTDEDPRATADEDLLVVSPYTNRSHLLDLTNLTQAQIYLAKALTILSPVTHAYATVPYTKAFNWDAVFTFLAAAVKAGAFEWTEQFFFIVVFRSQVPPSTDRSHLAELDEGAHLEAMKSGGLFKYWFGTPDADGRNLATCESSYSLRSSISSLCGRHLAST